MKEHQFRTLYISTALILTILMLSSCVGPYQAINPQEYDLPYQHYTNQDREMKIAWQADILKTTRNKKYKRIEDKRDIQLLVVKFKNRGEKEIVIPDDCILMGLDSTKLIPLTLEEVLDAFIGFYISEKEAKKLAYNSVIKIGAFFFNEARTVKSHIDFAVEMYAHYLESRVLLPGEEFSGLLALPLLNDETFQIMLTDDHF